jgi:hypothetical protein
VPLGIVLSRRWRDLQWRRRLLQRPLSGWDVRVRIPRNELQRRLWLLHGHLLREWHVPSARRRDLQRQLGLRERELHRRHVRREGRWRVLRLDARLRRDQRVSRRNVLPSGWSDLQHRPGLLQRLVQVGPVRVRPVTRASQR